jgi:hypothetical protein
MSKVTDYFAVQRYVRLRFFALVFGGALVVILVALAYCSGLLSPRVLGLVLIAYAACVGVAVFVILRSARAKFQVSTGESAEIADDATRGKFRKRIRNLKFGVAVFALVFVYALWETRGGPWLPRLVGATINLLFQAAMIHSIRRMQKLLKQ